MKGKRYSEEQIIRLLDEIDSGTTVAAARRKYNVSEPPVYRWRRKYRDMDVGQLKRLKKLERENARLKEIVAQQASNPGRSCTVAYSSTLL